MLKRQGCRQKQLPRALSGCAGSLPSVLSRLDYHDQDVPYMDQTGMLDDYHSMHGARCGASSSSSSVPAHGPASLRSLSLCFPTGWRVSSSQHPVHQCQ